MDTSPRNDDTAVSVRQSQEGQGPGHPDDRRPGAAHRRRDLRASKRFYVERGLSVKRSFPGRYVEFDAPAGGIKLALYPGRAGLAKDAGVSPKGDGPHGIALTSGAGQFSDPDGFVWEAA
jgi:hypothetical protein